MSDQDRPTIAALTVLIILQIIMLSALYALTKPHPPAAIPFFGMAPFLGASIATAVAAIILGPTKSGAGRGLSLLATVMALISFGPQKYFDAQFGLIWPAVIAGQCAAATIFYAIFGATHPKAKTVSAAR